MPSCFMLHASCFMLHASRFMGRGRPRHSRLLRPYRGTHICNPWRARAILGGRWPKVWRTWPARFILYPPLHKICEGKNTLCIVFSAAKNNCKHTRWRISSQVSEGGGHLYFENPSGRIDQAPPPHLPSSVSDPHLLCFIGTSRSRPQSQQRRRRMDTRRTPSSQHPLGSPTRSSHQPRLPQRPSLLSPALRSLPL